MTMERTTETEISGYISNVLRSHFGKGPSSVYVTLKAPFITIHCRGLNSPMEQLLLRQGEWERVLKTRDLILDDMKKEIMEQLRRMAGLDILDFFADWNLEHESGMFVGVLDEETEGADFEWPAGINREEVENKVVQASENAEKKPGKVSSFWLSDRTLLIERRKILVGIEKALIENGHMETLRLTKRPLERSLLYKAGLADVLAREVQEIFVDWDFDKDISYIVVVMAPA
ncbi:Na-translocating system protein MpsC family protein [Planococcus sp. FY231025]|uniref:Na-translocating system protein MpsC family protein n=1 Tax=Planococcus sp. FY231025 TaxID=3455699 RepID=UPI003F8E35AD